MEPSQSSTQRKRAAREAPGSKKTVKRPRTVKKEKKTANAGQNSLLDRVRHVLESAAPKRVTDDELGARLKINDEKKIQVINCIQRFLNEFKIKMFRSAQGAISYMWMSTQERHKIRQKNAKLRGLGAAAHSVYQEIEKSGNKGLGMRDLKYKTNLPTQQIRKLLHQMAQRSLIKWVHTIEAKNKKIWMLFGVEPSREVRGGPWYDDAKFDQDIVDVLYKCCLQVIKKREEATSEEVAKYLTDRKLLSVSFTVMDIEYILSALLLDGELESYIKPVRSDGKPQNGKLEQIRYYRPRKGGLLHSSFTDIPCAACPVVERCAEGREVNPNSCSYLTSWMEINGQF